MLENDENMVKIGQILDFEIFNYFLHLADFDHVSVVFEHSYNDIQNQRNEKT